MKAKNLLKKSLALVLTLVLVVLSVPMAALMASAQEAVVAPTPDASDIGSYINFYQSVDTFKEYDTTGSLKTNAGEFTTYGDNYTDGGTYYASVKMDFDEYFEWAFVKNEETGKWERGAGNDGIVWGQTGLKIGTYVDKNDKTQSVTLAYRRGQKAFYVMDPGGNSLIATGVKLLNGGQYNTVVMTAKYDSVNKLLTVWVKGDDNDVVVSDVIDMSAVKDFAFTGFDLRCGNGGAYPEDMDDITNENKVKNNVTFSDFHLWGDVTTTKHYMAPSIGANTNIANTLTLSDETLDADWKADGEFEWNYENVTFNGLNFKEKFAGKKIYASVTLTNIAKGSGANDTYGVSFATDGTNIASAYLRPQWNQQGISGLASTTLISTDGWGVAGNDGSLKNWDGAYEQVFIYEYDLDAGTVDIWRRTGLYNTFAHNEPYYAAEYQDLYVGKFSVTSDMILGLAIGPKADASTFTKNVKVSNVQVWTTGSMDTTNKLAGLVGYEGGMLDSGIAYNNTTDLGVTNTPVWEIGTTENNTGVYTSLKQGGYNGKKTVVWKGLAGDLSKGSIIYSADFTVYNKATGWGGDNWGLIVATVDGHYVSTGFGIHGAAGATYKNATVIDGSNIGEQAGANKTFLGASATGAISVAGTEEGVVVNVTAILTGTTLTTYIDGVKGQTFDFTGKKVVPQFGIAWGSGSANDTISNVKVYGEGVEVCTHSYDGCEDTVCNVCLLERVAGSHTYDDATDAYCNVCNQERVLFTLLYRAGNLAADYTSQIAGSAATDSYTLAPGAFATQSLTVAGAMFDYTKGYTVEADFTVTTNSAMESHFGITAITIDGTQYTFGMLSNGNWNTPEGNIPTQVYSPYIRKSNNNTLIGATGDKVTATDEGATVNLKVEVTSTGTVFYVNGTQANVITFEEGHIVAPFVGFTSRGAQVTVSNVKVYGAGATNCTHEYDNACDTVCNYCFNERVVGDDTHVYDNDYDSDCNNCGVKRTAPGSALPELGENQNLANSLVFNNADIQTQFAENGSITFGDNNTKAEGVLLNEDGSIVIKTDITFNGNVDYNWVLNEETGTYEYKNAWGRTGIRLGTYFSTGRERTMNVFVTYRRCNGGVYIWDDSQEVNGSQNPVVIGNIAANKETLSFVVKYDSKENAVAVWADGIYVGSATLEKFAEFNFGLGITQHGAGTSAVDPEDNTNGEKTANTVTYSNFEVYGDIECVHVYDDDCQDADCNKCGATREVTEHVFDDDCQDTTCANCSATREAADHVYDDDCQDTTCANCSVTREAVDHVFDDDCQDTTCANCAVTREAVDHVFDDDCEDTTCANCAVTREAVPHVYDNCDDTTCANCAVTREAVPHVYDDDCEDTTCANCDVTRPAADHVFDDDCQDTTCANCAVTREAVPHVYDNCEDTTCANCAVTREAGQHVYDDDCQDTTCANCDVTRPAAEHVFDDDCEDTTCANCAVTRPAAEHVYDNCDDTQCNNCAVTREAVPHVYDDDCEDTTCANCDVTRPAADHVFDDDCQDTTCANCAVTREAKEHVYDGCEDTTCANCAVTREAGSHSYDNACDAKCNICGEERTVGDHDWKAATCTSPKTCKECGATEGEALDHDWKAATCTAPKTCKRCGETEGTTKSHTYETTTTKATTSKNGKIETKCSVCGNVKSTTTIKYAKTFTLSATSYTYNGKVKTPTVTVKDSAGKVISSSNYTVTYASGRKNAGTYTVKITMKGNYTGTKTLSFKINPIDISKCSIKLSATSYTYNGSVKTPTVTVKNASGTKLTSGSSYTVTYASGRKNAGTYTVKVTMKGNYTGTKTLTFKINPIDISKLKLSISATSYTYDGKVKTPTITVKTASGTKLTKNTHYTVSYASGRKNVGSYTVKVTMKGNYKGTKTFTFKINPAKTTLTKVTPATKKLTVTYAKKTTQVTGYEIQYSTSKSFTTKTTKTKIVSKNSTTKATITGLKAKTTYYVRVRTYKTVGKTKYYSGWTTVKSAKTK